MKLSEQYEKKLHKLNEQFRNYKPKTSVETDTSVVTTTKKEEPGGIMDILNSTNAFGIPISAILATGIGAVAAWKARGWWQKITGKKIDANKLGFFKKNGLTVTQFYNKIYRDPKYLSKFQKDFGLTDSDIKIMLQDWEPIIVKQSQDTIDAAWKQIDNGDITAKQFLEKILPLIPRGKERRLFIKNLSSRLKGKSSIKPIDQSTKSNLPNMSFAYDWNTGSRLPNISHDEWKTLSSDLRDKLSTKLRAKQINPEDITFKNASRLVY
jgi:hypothetical protein